MVEIIKCITSLLNEVLSATVFICKMVNVINEKGLIRSEKPDIPRRLHVAESISRLSTFVLRTNFPFQSRRFPASFQTSAYHWPPRDVATAGSAKLSNRLRYIARHPGAATSRGRAHAQRRPRRYWLAMMSCSHP